MALITCSDCQKQVSDKAASCPHCGAPVFPTSTCNECGASVEKGRVACHQYGNPMTSAPSPSSPAPSASRIATDEARATGSLKTLAITGQILGGLGFLLEAGWTAILFSKETSPAFDVVENVVAAGLAFFLVYYCYYLYRLKSAARVGVIGVCLAYVALVVVSVVIAVFDPVLKTIFNPTEDALNAVILFIILIVVLLYPAIAIVYLLRPEVAQRFKA